MGARGCPRRPAFSGLLRNVIDSAGGEASDCRAMPLAEAVEPRFNVALFEDDMANCGWSQKDLAAAAQVSAMTVSRFFRADDPIQTNKTAAKLAKALGRPVRRYRITRGPE